MKKTNADKVCERFRKKAMKEKDADKIVEKHELKKWQYDEMIKWMREHEKVCPERKKQLKYLKANNYMGPAGGFCNYSLKITYTAIGDAIDICCDCGAKHDLTDWDNF